MGAAISGRSVNKKYLSAHRLWPHVATSASPRRRRHVVVRKRAPIVARLTAAAARRERAINGRRRAVRAGGRRVFVSEVEALANSARAPDVGQAPPSAPLRGGRCVAAPSLSEAQ